MANARDVKRRIKSVDNTRQITRTMELVATSKLKRATDRVEAATPYADALREIVESLYAPAFAEQFPLLRRPEREERVAVLLMTANRGLAGGFNANLIKEARGVLEDFRIGVSSPSCTSPERRASPTSASGGRRSRARTRRSATPPRWRTPSGSSRRCGSDSWRTTSTRCT